MDSTTNKILDELQRAFELFGSSNLAKILDAENREDLSSLYKKIRSYNQKIEVETYPDFVASHTEYQNYIYRIVLNDYEVNVKKIFDDYLQNLKHNKIYNYDFEDNSIIKIYANEKNINMPPIFALKISK